MQNETGQNVSRVTSYCGRGAGSGFGGKVWIGLRRHEIKVPVGGGEGAGADARRIACLFILKMRGLPPSNHVAAY